eukprot:3227676-Amphidinium_carterae.1
MAFTFDSQLLFYPFLMAAIDPIILLQQSGGHKIRSLVIVVVAVVTVAAAACRCSCGDGQYRGCCFEIL